MAPPSVILTLNKSKPNSPSFNLNYMPSLSNILTSSNLFPPSASSLLACVTPPMSIPWLRQWGMTSREKEKRNEWRWWALLKSRSIRGGSGSGGGNGDCSREGQYKDDLHLRLAMRVVEIYRAVRSINGGLPGVGNCSEIVKKRQSIRGEFEVTEYV